MVYYLAHSLWSYTLYLTEAIDTYEIGHSELDTSFSMCFNEITFNYWIFTKIDIFTFD